VVAPLDEGRLLERYPVEADGAHPAIRRRPVAAAWSRRCLTQEEREIKQGEIERSTARADRADPGPNGRQAGEDNSTHLAEGYAGADGDRTLGGGRRGGGGHGGGDREEGGDRARASGVGSVGRSVKGREEWM